MVGTRALLRDIDHPQDLDRAAALASQSRAAQTGMNRLRLRSLFSLALLALAACADATGLAISGLAPGTPPESGYTPRCRGRQGLGLRWSTMGSTVLRIRSDTRQYHPSAVDETAPAAAEMALEGLSSRWGFRPGQQT